MTPEAEYQTGFNHGYIITAHLPDLSDQLASIKSETPRIEGLKDGRKQYVLDQVREHRPSWMKGTQQNPKEKKQEKDKGHEPDR